MDWLWYNPNDVASNGRESLVQAELDRRDATILKLLRSAMHAACSGTKVSNGIWGHLMSGLFGNVWNMVIFIYFPNDTCFKQILILIDGFDMFWIFLFKTPIWEIWDDKRNFDNLFKRPKTTNQSFQFYPILCVELPSHLTSRHNNISFGGWSVTVVYISNSLYLGYESWALLLVPGGLPGWMPMSLDTPRWMTRP